MKIRAALSSEMSQVIENNLAVRLPLHSLLINWLAEQLFAKARKS